MMMFDNIKNEPIAILEIGSFEGLSAAWMLENIMLHPASHMICVDPFTGNDEHSPTERDGLFARFQANVLNNYPGRVTCIQEESHTALKALSLQYERDQSARLFDIIYIDGDHHASAVLEDMVLAYRLLKKHGVMVIDDFLWNHCQLCSLKHPYPGINAFMSAYANKMKVIYAGYQLFLQKLV